MHVKILCARNTDLSALRESNPPSQTWRRLPWRMRYRNPIKFHDYTWTLFMQTCTVFQRTKDAPPPHRPPLAIIGKVSATAKGYTALHESCTDVKASTFRRQNFLPIISPPRGSRALYDHRLFSRSSFLMSINEHLLYIFHFSRTLKALCMCADTHIIMKGTVRACHKTSYGSRGTWDCRELKWTRRCFDSCLYYRKRDGEIYAVANTKHLENLLLY